MIQKPRFLFIHGAGGTKSKWRLLSHYFQEGEAEYIDLPGRDGLGEESIPFSIEEFARTLNQVIQDDVIVVGHSMGGLIGVELATINEKVKGLVLAASHYRLPVHSKVLDKLKEGLFPEGLFHASYAKNSAPELLELEKRELNLVPKERTFLDYEACNRYTKGKETLSRLSIPILALYGEEDRLLPENAQEELVAANPRAHLQVIPQASHYLMLEQPAVVSTLLADFKDQLS